MESNNKKIYIYFIDNDKPVVLNAMGYYINDNCYIVVDYDNQETARFDLSYVKGIAKQ